MKIEFDVQMTVAKMYDYMLYHTFHGMQGILGEMVGILLIIGFVITDPHKWIYLICGLIVLFYLFIDKWWLSLPVMLAFMVWWGLDGGSFHLFGIKFGIQMFAVMALPLIYIPTWSKLKINKWVYYLFYPAHLIGIMLIQFALALG